MAQLTEEFVTVGLNEQLKELDKLLASDPEMEKALRELVREVLLEARGELAADARSGLQMKGDPRDAYRAIRTTVYRQLLGGNVNILRKRKAGDPRDIWLPSGHTGRGGNRRPRSGRTKALQSYWGPDRGFVLRFLNQGASDRHIEHFRKDPHRDKVQRGSRGGDVNKYGATVNTGNRGSIRGRNWFGSASYKKMQEAAETLTAKIEQLIAERVKG